MFHASCFMIIGIDASALTLPNPTGVQRYTEAIISALLKEGTEHTFRLYSPKPLPEPFTSHQVIIKSPRFWTQIRLPLELLLHKPDVFFQPSYMLPPYCPVPSVVTVHDLGWIKFSKAYSQSQVRLEKIGINRILSSKCQIIVPSESAYKDCVSLLGIPAKRIHVISEALIKLPNVKLNDYPEIEKYQDKNVILAVGRLEERKNTAVLVKAVTYLQSKVENETLTLVLVGQPGFGGEEIYAEIAKARQKRVEVILVKDADDSKLSAWFSVAKVLVYPSLYEGFGLPILQAFAANIPVIATQVSSIPEVGGDAVQYVKDVKSEEELAIAINSVIFDQEKSKKLIIAGKEQLKKFSWEIAAKETLKVLLSSSKL